jgi:lipoate-protein ligase A
MSVGLPNLLRCQDLDDPGGPLALLGIPGDQWEPERCGGRDVDRIGTSKAQTAGKIGGAAQTRRRNAVLHHVTMAYNIDSAKMLEVLRIGREKLSDKGTPSAAKRVDPLRSQTGLPRGDIIDGLVATFRQHNGLQDAELSADDLTRAEQLVATKFGTAAWANVVP